ncbi:MULTISPECIES: efflux transporter outer membrane subunit [Sphingobium]|uniref:efflux transporter outer membrane subunit n=1 Tax=Sphingobium TaxID=165695 RepID=UPI0015EC3619|nr:MULTISPECIES: efflux transporter outer membrane subunit [Sphingobium]MCW2363907.1 NodT family efflux transporter outer membrane factor (OMF) lipoprotein [Sphingobium sp. B10D3B]MCW2402696.1 NodT family efflux transporter outer membrane factor (OMF) lipoprotein [Sphingobium sp. B10D7B]MCW2409675.1 NodT family efflux transporter outer membrane factor (OMF) lipoprotein [Sphingobium xanthum]
MRPAIALLGVACLSGCMAPPTPLPPSAAVTPPAGWQNALAGEGAVNAGWWRAFNDPALTQLVETAIANNVDIAIAAARVREARAQERLARAQLFPTLDATAAGSHGRSLNPFGQATEGTSAQPALQVAYELDLFGRIDDQTSAARSAWLASQAARDATALSVSAATASGYITLLALDARRDVVRRTIAARAESLRIARSRAEAGYTSQLELRQAEAEYQAAAIILPQVDLAILRQENALRLLTGDGPGVIQRGGSLDALVAPPVPDQGLPSELLRRRPDIAQAEFALAASDSTLSAARKQFLPSLRLSAAAGAIFSSALANPVTIWSVGGSVLAPLFEGGRLRAGVETAAARRDQAAFAYRKTALTAFGEVENALGNVSSLRQQRASAEAQRAAIADALRHATNRYRAGYSSYLEELDAQRALLSADLALVQLRSDQLNALVTLYQVLGGGWESDAR